MSSEWPLGFSTLGCPQASAAEVAALTARHGMRHVDLRAHADGPVHVGMSERDRREWRRVLDEAGVSVTTVAGYVKLADDTQHTRAVVDDAQRHLDLAQDLGADGVRVFCGGAIGTDTTHAARERLSAILDATADRTERILLETHDSRPRGQDVAAVLDGMPVRAAAIWDAVIPWASGEPPEATAAALGSRIAMVQVKDARGTVPVLPGSGEVPLPRILLSLDRIGWQGVLSFEWERAWYPDLPPLDDAVPAARAWLRSSAPDGRPEA